MKMNKMIWMILAAMILGIAAGYLAHTLSPSPAVAKEIASYFNIVTDVFLRLIKMIIAPLVLATLVSGLAGMGDSKTIDASAPRRSAGLSVHLYLVTARPVLVQCAETRRESGISAAGSRCGNQSGRPVH